MFPKCRMSIICRTGVCVYTVGIAHSETAQHSCLLCQSAALAEHSPTDCINMYCRSPNVCSRCVGSRLVGPDNHWSRLQLDNFQQTSSHSWI